MITYNLEGGEANNPVSYNVETNSFTLAAPTKIGYILDGWLLNGELFNVNTPVEKDLTLNPKWKKEKALYKEQPQQHRFSSGSPHIRNFFSCRKAVQLRRRSIRKARRCYLTASIYFLSV